MGGSPSTFTKKSGAQCRVAREVDKAATGLTGRISPVRGVEENSLVGKLASLLASDRLRVSFWSVDETQVNGWQLSAVWEMDVSSGRGGWERITCGRRRPMGPVAFWGWWEGNEGAGVRWSGRGGQEGKEGGRDKNGAGWRAPAGGKATRSALGDVRLALGSGLWPPNAAGSAS